MNADKTILIIDDDPRNRKLAGELLGTMGYKIIEAENGQEGIDLAKSEQPAMILMDIMMPVMDGIEATRRLKADKKTCKIPIIILSSKAMKEDRDTICKSGCDGYLTKPFDIYELLDLINNLIKKQNSLDGGS